MRVLRSSEMRELDRKTIEELGIPSRVLMERAGVSVVLSLEQEIGDLSNRSFVVMIGKGNNGGDGLVVARTLLDYSYDVTAVLLTRNLKGDPLENLRVFEKMGGEVLVLGEDLDLPGLESLLMGVDVVVDALLGIGLKGEVKKELSEIIEMMNMSPAYKVCVDISSGVDSDTGAVMGCAVKCDLTVTFALPKVGHILYPGREYTGKLKVASIGIPKSLMVAEKGRFIITDSMVRSLLPDRPKDSNKGTFGKVGIIAGSAEFTGAPVLAGLGSMRSGAGLTFIFMPEPFNTVATASHPELISIPVKSCGGYFCEDSLNTVMEYVEKLDVLAIGPGLSRREGVRDFVKKILKLDIPMVVDADGLNNISPDDLKGREAPTIVTPHPGEFARLLGKSIAEVKYNYELAEEFAKEHGCVVVLKGATTIVTNGEITYFNITGDTGLAKGGSGDVLTGIIASFIAQGLKPLEAAAVAVYVHGATSLLYHEDQAGMIPSDIAALIPRVLRKLRESS